jgi:peptide/nickel transport system permease protein
MFIFILRRFVTSALVVLASTFVMYILTDIAIDPLDDLRTSTAPNKQQLIEGRIAQLRLDEPVVTRYVDWLAGASKCVIGQCDLGTAWRSGQSVTSMLGGAILTTIQLVTAATLLAILVGVAVGIVSALRQYSGFDYSVTFLSDATGTLAFKNEAGAVSAEELHKTILVVQASRFSKVMTTELWLAGLNAGK